MFDIGFWELTIIAVVGLIVIGPDKLPGVARTVGKWVGRTRRFINQVKSDIDREIKQDELRKALDQDAGLDEIKQILDTDRYSFEEEQTPDYQVKAMPDESDEKKNTTTTEEDTTSADAGDKVSDGGKQ